jgi:hypothetical protein
MYKKNDLIYRLKSIFRFSRKSVFSFAILLSVLSAGLLIFFSPSRAATGNVSGTLFSSYQSGNGLAEKTITLLVGNTVIDSAETDENGEFLFSEVAFTNGELLTLYVDDEEEKAVSVYKLGDEVVDGNLDIDLAAGYVSLLEQDESAIVSYEDLAGAEYADSDITDLVTVTDEGSDGDSILVSTHLILDVELDADALVFDSSNNQEFHNVQSRATSANFIVRTSGSTFAFIGNGILPNATLTWDTSAGFSRTGNMQLDTLNLVSGTFTAPGVDGSLNLQQMVVDAAASFVHNSGVVLFDGPELALLAHEVNEITFANLAILGAGAATFTVESGLDIVVENQVNLSGADSTNRLAIQPSDAEPFRFLMSAASSMVGLQNLRVEGSTIVVEEGNESITLPVNPSDSLNGGNNTGWFGVTLSLVSDGAEPDTPAIFEVTTPAANDSGAPFTVNYAFTDGTATGGQDYTNTQTSVEIPNGESSAEITVAILDDDIVEDTENFSLELVSADSLEIDDTPVEAEITDDDTVGVSISPTSVTSTEGGETGSYSVVLESQPTGNVVIAALPDANTSLSSTTLTFTTENWDDPQSVTVTAVNDDIVEGSHTSTITHAINTVSTQDALYDALEGLSSVTNTITDNDSPGFSLSEDTLTLSENGGSDTFTVALDKQPLSDVVLTVASSAPAEATVSPATLTFTSEDWDEPQEVTVTGVDDDIDRDDLATVTISVHEDSDELWTGLEPQTVDVTLTDDDISNVEIAPTTLSTTEGGATANYSIVLTSEPTGAVVITLSTDTDQNTLSETALTFSSENWDDAQSITVTAVDDDIVEGNHSATITHAIDTQETEDAVYGALDNLATVTNNITDNDTGSIEVSTNSVTISEAGGSTTVEVSLSAEPADTVVLSVISNDTGEATVSPATLTFTSEDWDEPQEVTVTGVDDDIDRNDSTSIEIAVINESSPASWADLSQSISVTLTDDDTAGVTIDPTSISTTEGGSTAQYSVRLNSQPLGNVTITPTPDGQTQISPANLVFTTENWNSTQEFTATAVDDDVVEGEQTSSISHAATSDADENYAGISIASVTNTITDNDIAGFTLTPNSLLIDEGSSDSFLVTLDAAPLTSVTLQIASSDTAEATVSPTSVQLNSSNWDDGVSVTVNSVEDDHISEDSATITVSVSDENDAPWDNLAEETVSVTFGENDTAGVTITPTSIATTEGDDDATYTVVLDSAPEGTVVITISSDEQSSTDKSSLTFSTANWSTEQTVTVTAVDDSVTEGTHQSTISHAIDTELTFDSNYDELDDLASVTNTITDNDTPGFTVTPDSFNILEGESDSLSIQLDTQPQSDVVLSLSSSDTNIVTLSESSLTFTSENWQQEQEVTLTTVNNNTIGNASAEITIGIVTEDSPEIWDSIEEQTLSVSVTDDDEVGVMFAPSSLQIEEGSDGTVEISLSAQPQDGMTVSLNFTPSSDELDLGAGAGETFTQEFTDEDWDTPQTLTILVADNAVRDGNRSASIEITVNTDDTTDTDFLELDLADEITVTILDNETDPEVKESKSSKSRSSSSKKTETCSLPAPSSIPELFQISVTNTTAELAFVPSENATHYAVRYSTSAEGEEYATLFEHRDNSGVVLTSINDLTPGTTYYFTVRGLNDCAPGEWSAQLSATTTRTTSTQNTFYVGGESSNPSASVNIPSIQRATPLPQAEQNTEEREDTESNTEPGAPSNEADTSTETPVQPTSFLQRLWNGIQNLFR